VIEDPEIPDNKLIKVEELIGDRKESFVQDWGISNPSQGLSVAFRAKASEGILNAQSTDGNLYRYIYMSPRNGAFREQLQVQYPGQFEANYMNIQTDFPNAHLWHIYRITLKRNLVNIYVDENPVPVISGSTPKSTEDNFLKFGDTSTGGEYGGIFDWIIWDLSGAYAPGEGTPIPQELLSTGSYSAVKKRGDAKPRSHVLFQNYPNPFNPSTHILFNLAESGHVSLKIYDINGRLIITLIDDIKQAGQYQTQWNGQDSDGMHVPAGIYLYTLESGSRKRMKKMSLIK
jgi:hypothetical protein